MSGEDTPEPENLRSSRIWLLLMPERCPALEAATFWILVQDVAIDELGGLGFRNHSVLVAASSPR